MTLTVMTLADFFQSLLNSAFTRIFGAVVTAALVIIAGKVVMRLLRRSVGKSKMDPTLQKFLISVVRVLVWFIAILIVASSLGIEVTSLVALASVVSAAFALAASGMLSNLFGGLQLLMTKPFGVGDYILTEGVEGTVQEIGLVNTKVNTVDNKRVTVPNNTICSATITNCTTEGKRRVDLIFKVGYDNDAEQVKAAIRRTAERHEKVVDKEKIFVRVSGYEDSCVAYTLRAWTATEDYWDVHFDMLEQVKQAFDQLHISMVYPYLNVIMDRPERE